MMNGVERQYVSAQKAEQLHESRGFADFQRSVQVQTVYDGTILPVRKMPNTSNTDGQNRYLEAGGVINRDGRFIENSSIPGWIEMGYSVQKSAISPESVVYCGRMIGQWGHFLLETITRLWYFLEHDKKELTYVFVVREKTNPEIEPSFIEFFNLLGIKERIKFINEPIQYKKVIVPERSFQYGHFFTEQYISILDTVCKAAERNKCCLDQNISKKVYLSRGKFEKARRSEAGLEMLDDYFIRNGYSIIYPEKLALSTLIKAIRRADIVAAESGTCAHNFLFCNEGQKVTVIERQVYVNDAQTAIDRVRCLHATYVEAALTIQPVCHGQGPFILAFTPFFEAYSKDRNEVPPERRYLSSTYLKTLLQKYRQMKKYIQDDELLNPRTTKLFEESKKMTRKLLTDGLLTDCKIDE